MISKRKIISMASLMAAILGFATTGLEAGKCGDVDADTARTARKAGTVGFFKEAHDVLDGMVGSPGFEIGTTIPFSDGTKWRVSTLDDRVAGSSEDACAYTYRPGELTCQFGGCSFVLRPVAAKEATEGATEEAGSSRITSSSDIVTSGWYR